MATKRLIAGGKAATLNFPAGTVVVFKVDQLSIAGNLGAKETHIDLYNDDEDIILRMTIRRGQSKVFLNDRAHQSLVDGWGQERSVDLSPVDVERWHRLGVTISVHNCSTRYQILFDLTTMFYFPARFHGPAITIKYSTISRFLQVVPQLSDPLQVGFYELNTLPFMERQAITSGSVPAPGSAVISHFAPNKPGTISWDDGKEIRGYQIGPQHVLHEYTYSTKHGNGWQHGNLHTLQIVLSPTSSIAPIRLDDGVISVYYQDPTTGFIRSVSEAGGPNQWTMGSPVAKAVTGSSIAIVLYFDAMGRATPRLYYQDLDLHLRERYYDSSLSTWVIGDFNPGVQPRGTPISAEVIQGGDVDINVIWRDSRGRAVVSSWSKSLGWDIFSPNGGRALLGD